MVDLSKRRLFTHVKEYIEKAQNLPRLFPRPPTAVPESRFIELCNGCNECVIHCPQKIITLHEYMAIIHTDLNHCIHCNQCKSVCPTGALDNSLSDTYLRPRFLSNCNPIKVSYCAECLNACEKNAINIQPKSRPELDSHLCNGCAKCHVQCPNSAIEMVLKIRINTITINH